MNTSRWIVVANASQARILEHDAATDALVVRHELSHPASRAKASELATDRPGHEATDNSPGGNRFEPRSDPRRKEHHAFAREIAGVLDEAWKRGQQGSICIAASSPFLGELKKELGDALRDALDATVDSDLTSLDPRELLLRLRRHGAGA
jgi:protein required for attachment to host cells